MTTHSPNLTSPLPARPPDPSPPIEHSILATLMLAKEPVAFELLVERVQKHSPQHTRVAIAATLGTLITRQRVFLNQERTGFCAARMKRDSQRNMERAVRLMHQSSRAHFR